MPLMEIQLLGGLDLRQAEGLAAVLQTFPECLGG
jgi:hypothetical protein